MKIGAIVKLAGVGLMVAVMASACTLRGPKLAPLPADALVLAFGDSITYGTGAAPGQSYPEVLGTLTGRKVVGAGVPGEVTAEGLARLPEALDGYRPALLVLCHGGNDLLRGLGEEQAAGNIRAMVRLARERGVDVVLIGIPRPGLLPAPPGFYEKIAKEFAIPYEGNVLKKIERERSLKADAIHPNADGYRLMAETVARLLHDSGAL